MFEKLKQTYGRHSLYRAQVFRWYKSFLKDREHVEDEHRSGKPSTSETDQNIERVITLVISSSFNIKNVDCAKMVMKNLTIKQKGNWKTKYLYLLNRKGDESWISKYDLETKKQRSALLD